MSVLAQAETPTRVKRRITEASSSTRQRSDLKITFDELPAEHSRTGDTTGNSMSSHLSDQKGNRIEDSPKHLSRSGSLRGDALAASYTQRIRSGQRSVRLGSGGANGGFNPLVPLRPSDSTFGYLFKRLRAGSRRCAPVLQPESTHRACKPASPVPHRASEPGMTSSTVAPALNAFLM